MKRQSIFLGLFLLVSATNLVANLISQPQLLLFSKPLILLTLIGYYVVCTQSRSMIFIQALLFSWAGDVLLIFVAQHEVFFMLGLSAFLISHVLFIKTYRMHRTSNIEKELLGTQKTRFAFPIVLATTGLIVILYNSLGPLKIPVMGYALVLCVMVLTAMFRYGRTSSKSFWLVLAGALFFMASDSMLALNKFLSPIEGAGFYIMLTYISAQFLIVRGILNHTNEHRF